MVFLRARRSKTTFYFYSISSSFFSLVAHTLPHAHVCADHVYICVISSCQMKALFSGVTQFPAELAGLKDRMSHSRGVFVFNVLMLFLKYA